jgi:hypothetical protein
MDKRPRKHALTLATTVGLALVASSAFATSIVALPDGKRTTLQAALEQAQSSSTPTVIVLPAGAWNYGDSGVEVDHLENVVLLGAGASHTRLYRSVCHGGAILQVNRSENLRISGIKFDGCDATSTDVTAEGIALWDAKNFRVDHCSFKQHSWAAVRVHGEHSNPRGVVDHCTFEHIFQGKHEGYGVAVTNNDVFLHEPFGSPKATFIEDCEFSRTRHAASANGAGRYVFRYNTVTNDENSHAVDAHGAEGASHSGTEWVEIYKNRIEQPIYDVAAVRIRGGKALVWDNEVHGYQIGVSLWEETGVPTGPVHIWGNDFGSAQSVGDLRGSPSYAFGKPAGYAPYTYPHPLVSDLEPKAGFDQKVMVGQDGLGRVYLDATSSSVSAGTIVGYRWYDGADLVSSCARSVLELEPGRHVIVLEAERSDGLVEYDTALVDVLPSASLVSSKTLRERWFVPIVGQGTIDLDVTPASAPMNGYVGFTGRRQVDAHADVAVRVRFNDDGRIDARDGDAGWSAESNIGYQAHQTHHLTLDVDLASHRFGVTVDGVVLAQDYRFTTNVATIGQLVVWSGSGTLKVEHLALGGALAQPDPACAAEQDAGGSGGAEPGNGDGAAEPAGTPGADGADDETAAAPGEAPVDDEPAGCACSTSGSRGAPGPWWPLAAALALGWRAATRRAPQRSAGRCGALRLPLGSGHGRAREISVRTQAAQPASRGDEG